MRIIDNASLKDFTTIGIGGSAQKMYVPGTIEELKDCITNLVASQTPYFVLGGGSNTVFCDDEYQGQAIVSMSELKSIEFDIEDGLCTMNVQAGAVLQDIVDLAQKHNAVGLTGLNRVPGSLGGAILGNAGAYGCEIAQSVVSVEVLMFDEFNDSHIETIKVDDDTFSYRTSSFKHMNGIILTATLKLAVVSAEEYQEYNEKYNTISEKRDAVYPPDLKSPGSLFKNILIKDLDPEVLAGIPSNWIVYGKLPAGRLLEEVGAKGFAVGDMHMRTSHANILINDGEGTQKDALTLIRELQNRVKERFGVELQPEVRFIPGNFDSYKHNEI